VGVRNWLSKRRKPKEFQELVSKGEADKIFQDILHERINTVEQARAIYDKAQRLYKKGDFLGAIALYDELLAKAPIGMVNPYMVRKVRAIACCEAGRFAEAEQELNELLGVLMSGGSSASSSSVRYWYLVARYKGDKKKAMDEFVKV